jgi:hypothetical protein
MKRWLKSAVVAGLLALSALTANAAYGGDLGHTRAQIEAEYGKPVPFSMTMDYLPAQFRDANPPRRTQIAHVLGTSSSKPL